MLDASIPLGVRPLQVQNPLNAMAQVLQIQGAQDEAAQRRRALAAEEGLNAAYAGALGPDGQVDRNAMYRTLAGKGFGSKIPGLQKQFAEADKAQVELRLKAAENYKHFQSAVGALASDPGVTKDKVVQSLQMGVQAGAFDPAISRVMIEKLPDDPAQLRQHLSMLQRSQLTPEQQIKLFAPDPENVDNGQQIITRDKNALSPTFGQQIGGAPVQKQTTPDARLSADISTANNQRSVAAQYANAQATRDAARTQADATRAAAEVRDRRDTEMKLADDYRAQSKNFKEVADASNRVKAALPSATTSAASTLAAATSFMKMLDPGSVVRESELGMALAATGAIDRLTNYHNTLAHGKVLTPAQSKDFGDITEKVLQAAKQGQQAIDSNYRRQAQQYGLRPEMIVQELGQGGGGTDLLDAADRIIRGGR